MPGLQVDVHVWVCTCVCAREVMGWNMGVVLNPRCRSLIDGSQQGLSPAVWVQGGGGHWPCDVKGRSCAGGCSVQWAGQTVTGTLCVQRDEHLWTQGLGGAQRRCFQSSLGEQGGGQRGLGLEVWGPWGLVF